MNLGALFISIAVMSKIKCLCKVFIIFSLRAKDTETDLKIFHRMSCIHHSNKLFLEDINWAIFLSMFSPSSIDGFAIYFHDAGYFWTNWKIVILIAYIRDFFVAVKLEDNSFDRPYIGS